MIERRASEFLRELYRGTRGQRPDRFRAWALERLKDLIQFDSAMWGTSSNDPRCMYEVYLHDQPAEMLENYARFEDQDLLRTAVCAAPPGRTVNLADVVSPEEWARSDIYRNHADRFGIRATLCSIDVQPVTGIVGVISLWRADLYRQFNETERCTKEFIAPHLFETWRHNRLLFMHRAHASHEHALDAPAIAYRDGLLLEADAGFVGRLRTEWPEWQGGRLPDPLIDELIERDLDTHVGRRTVTHARRSGELVLLTIHRKQLSDALTARECAIAGLYAAGNTHKAVAGQLQLSPTTVKSHLRRIYTKLGINNKTQLINLLERY